MTWDRILNPPPKTAPREVAPEGMSAAELTVQRDALKRAMDRLAVIKTNCGHCQRFELGACSLHGEVPQEFQRVEGQCEDWRYDGVPF